MSFLFGGGQDQSSTPNVTPTPRVPTVSILSRRAASQDNARVRSRSGRSSTLLSRRGGEAGTTAYTNSLLGQTG